MKKVLILFVVALLGTSLLGQNFRNVGPINVPVATNVSEMDFEVSDNGVPYVFYVSSTTNKGTVKKWSGSSWVLVGTSDFTSANPFQVDLEVNGNNVYVAYYYVSGTGTTSERIGVHKSINGAAFTSMGSYYYPSGGSQVIVADHGRPFDLENKYGTIRLAFFEPYQDNYFRYCSWNSGGYFEHIGGLDLDDDDNDYQINALKVHIDDDGYEWYVASVEGMGFETNLYQRNGSSWVSKGSIYGGSYESSTAVGMDSYWDTNGDYLMHSVAGIKDEASDHLHHSQFYNDATPSWTINDVQLTSGSNISEFDMAATESETYYFYKKASQTYFDKKSNLGGAISSITSFGPAGTKTNLRVDLKQNDKPVVAFLNSGSVWVQEDWTPVSFSAADFNTCSGTTETLNSHVTVSSSNLDNSDLGWNVTPNLPSVMYSSAITGTYPNYNLSVATYFQSSTQAVSIDIDLEDETGSVDQNNVITATVKSNDSIINNAPFTSLCLNAGVKNMANYLYPLGGMFTGNITSNGMFNTNTVGVGVHSITYKKVNASGCSSTKTFQIQVLDMPVLTMSSTPASCGDSTGTASVSATSIAFPHVYYWNTGATTSSLTDLPSGSYVVTLTDNNGCMRTGVANVGNLSVNLVANVTDVNCPTDNNGSIDLTVAGVGPFNILWSNGYGTEDITGLIPGMYDVVVTDANGCKATQTYEVTGPSPILVSATTTNSSCGTNNGIIVVTVTGGTGSYSYQWYDENNNAIGTNSATINGIGGGLYKCVITDGNGCSKTFNKVLNENGAPDVTINSVTSAGCLNDGGIDMSYTASAALDHIEWSNGASTEDITGLAPGHYAVWVVDVNGCIGMADVDVNPALPVTPEICMVTVDSVTTTNLIVWEKPVSTSIAHFNIYREGSQAGLYQIVDSVPYSSVSEYNDIVASPMVRSWRYKLSAVDNCGNESALSDYHKTIHATVNVGLGGNFNILWDAYEGLTYSSWSCWRYTTAAGLEMIWTNSSNIFSYTDQPATTAGLDYVIGFPLGFICTSSQTKSQDYNGTRSNRSAGVFNGSGLSIDEISKTDFDVVLFPNPNEGIFNVHITGTANGNFDYQVMDVTGKLIQTGVQSLRKFEMNLSELESGIYYLNISNAGISKTQKVIIK